MLDKLNRINFILLVALGTLCVFQWSGENESRRRIGDLQKSRDTQAQKLSEQGESLRAANEDLTGFRTQVVAFKAQTDEQSAQLRGQTAQIARLEEAKTSLTRQLDVWRKGVEDYKAALETRDASIKTLLDQRDQLYAANKTSVERANQAVVSLNDLNVKYSDIVTRYNDLVAKTQAQTQPAPVADTH